MKNLEDTKNNEIHNSEYILKGSMMDITASQIIASFWGIQRKRLTSSTQSDQFLDLMKAKQSWTMDEYKQVKYAYGLNSLGTSILDMSAFKKIEKAYGFEMTWDDYFSILDSIKSLRKQKKYANFYLWYYASKVDHDVYKKFKKKSYFSLLTDFKKVDLLDRLLNSNKDKSWIKNEFTSHEIKKCLQRGVLYSHFNISIEKLYHDYQASIDQHITNGFFSQSILLGDIDAMTFLYPKMLYIKKSEILSSLSSLSSLQSSSEIIKILYHLKELGVRFTSRDLDNIKNNPDWQHLPHKETICIFLQELSAEKLSQKLEKKLAIKPLIKHNKI